MKSIMKLVISMALAFALVLSISSCSVIDPMLGDLEFKGIEGIIDMIKGETPDEGPIEDPIEDSTLVPPGDPDGEKPGENEQPTEKPDDNIVVDHTSLEIVDGEVFAYDKDGARIDYNRRFLQYESNTYYAIENKVVKGDYVIEGYGYRFSDEGIKQDVVLNEIFIECENATYYIVNNITVYNQIVINGAVYDFGTDGKMIIGENGEYTYGEDGKLVANEIFITINNATYYIVNNITVYNEIVIDGAVYDFGTDGKMTVGEKDGYIFGEDGKLVADKIFITINNATYYIVKNITVYNQIVIDGAVYDFGTDGKMTVGEKDGYIFGEDGKLVADKIFITINNATYYIVNNITVYNQIVIDGAVYDFGTDGKMTVGEKDGYVYDSEGKLVADKIFITINNATYYIVNNITVYNQIVIDGAVYDFGTDGKMTVGEKDGYVYDSEGKLVANEIFITINNATYYIVNNVTVYNQIIIDGYIYDFGEDGKMNVGSSTEGGSDYTEDGKLVANEIFVTINNKTYYVENNVTVTNTYKIIDGKIYYFTEDGSRVENGSFGDYTFSEDGSLTAEFTQIVINNVTYYIINNYIYGGAYFSGTVYESDGDRDSTNNPKLSGVYVVFEIAGKTFTATTAADGTYDLGLVPAGVGTLTLTLDGYIQVSTTVDTTASLVKTIVMDRNVSNNLSGKVVVADADTNASNNVSLAGALVTLERTSGTNVLYYETTTDSYGNYYFNNLTAGSYKLTITAEGYLTIEQTVFVKYNEQNVYNASLEAIKLPESSSPDAPVVTTGSASGIIKDARTAAVITTGLAVYVYPGINNIDGEPLLKVYTDANGQYLIENLEAGNYTAYIVDERELSDENYRYGSLTVAVKILPGVTISGQDASVSNSIGLSVDGIRVVLTWGSAPRDLDSHTTFGGNHVYYGQKNLYNVSLDVDDTSGYGPETTTITNIDSYNYTYTYYVYNYTGSPSITASGAQVQIYFGNTLAYTLYVPTSGSGYNWNVFTYNSQTGEFKILNTIS